MTSAHGSKTFVAGLIGVFVVCSTLLGIVMSEKKSKIRLYEKSYSAAVSELEKMNRVEVTKGAGTAE